MAVTEAYSGLTATITSTEYSLPLSAAFSSGSGVTGNAGVFQLYLDVNAMTASEQYQLRLYEKISAFGTQRLVQEWVLTGVQPNPGVVLPPFMLFTNWDLTLKKLAGTDRAFSWSIRKG